MISLFIEAMVLGFIVAIFRKGRIRNIGNMHIKGWYLFLIAGLIQGCISWLKGRNLILGPEFFDKYFVYILLFTYLIMIAGVILNIKKKFMKFILIGIMLNFIVIFANGGKMPVSFKGFTGYEHYTENMPEKSFDIKHSLVTEDTKLVYLADVIVIPRPYPLARIISVGDIFLMIGVFLFFQEAMVRGRWSFQLFS